MELLSPSGHKRRSRNCSFAVLAAFCCLLVECLSQDLIVNRCTSHENCGECIQDSPDCAWCSQGNYSEKTKARCDLLINLKGSCDSISKPEGFVEKITDLKMSDAGAKEDEAIQIKPQEIRIRMRANSEQMFLLEFRQAVDYPVDLYYLLDLSNSMLDDKEKLADLGNKLAHEMKSITNNFRLGFGSFVDKTTSPFVSVHPDKLKKPCDDCAAPYGFRNTMPLSLKTREFAEKVRASPISGNIDAPEGGLDAIMQAVVCKTEIGWRNMSRKLLVFSTDSSFHYAGDGKMGGIIAPNDEQCHLDRAGWYTATLEQDYPSLSQVNRQIREHKVNIIFAVTGEQQTLYRSLSRRLTGSFTGKLEQDSSNVVGLVREQYEKIRSSVEITNNAAEKAPHLRISYFSKCLGHRREKTNVCNDLSVGKTVQFEVVVEASFCPPRGQWNGSFEIFPVGLHDHLTVHFETICECECEKEWNEEKSSPKCSDGKGTFECGICNCDESYDGKECECDIKEADPFDAGSGCYHEEGSTQCSGAGTCRCGKCVCYPRLKPDEKIYGTHCECNNYSCERTKGLLCNGEGVCDCGQCRCRQGWSGDNCGCKEDRDACLGKDGKVCGGHGSCVCGACVCDVGAQEYFGKHCDDCSSCPGKCDELRSCAECWMNRKQEDQFLAATAALNCSGCPEHLLSNLTADEGGEKEKQCSFEDEEGCRFSLKYAFDEQNALLVQLLTLKECPPAVPTLAIVSGVSSGVVAAGLLLLLLWKIITTLHDRRELAKFEKERKMAKWQQGENPIYKQATSTFQNPAYRSS